MRLDVEHDRLETSRFGQTLPVLTRLYRDLDQSYMTNAIDNSLKFSGSCSTSLIVQASSVSIINVGDSRVIMSLRSGHEVLDLTIDHKPERESEFERVIESGGELYRISSNTKTGELKHYFSRSASDVAKVNDYEKSSTHLIFGPWRIKPGGLSVSKSFGDIESKLPSYGGMHGTVVVDPELFQFPLDDADFIILGCKFIRRWHI